ncbi:hypothetical protein [Shewanella acanthi]|uniref:hypothetical protein n=1 Tax=Shewanella acanthi TaxID=2864212 RepID=UPI001C65BD65|nr:hypothetical protein [Shewanella acanthi]MCH1930064.1 hypothetical protein [Shewanella shenzhenensis]QYJ77430.1 hypothetical protein K0H61_09690 [Shewanella acanthi]
MTHKTPTGPIVNVDGTPMMGDSGIDVHGNPYGVTNHDSSLFSCSANDDSWSSFDNSFSSSFDDSFSSSFGDDF